MATPIDYSKLLLDPEFQAALESIPMQPQVQGIEPSTSSFASMSMTEMPQSEKEIQKMIRDKFMQSQMQQEQQIKENQKLLSKEMERRQQLGVLGRLDLRPFAQAAQQYGATTAVVPTAAPEDRTEIIQKLQEQVQRGQRGLTQDQIGFLRTMMEDKRAAQLGQSEKNREMRVFENISRKFDKTQTEMSDFYQARDTFKSAIDAGDVAAIQSSLANFARMTGEKGVLTDQDIGRAITPTFALKFAQIRSKLLSDPSTPVPEDTLKSLKEGLGRLEKAANDKFKSKIDAIERQTVVGPGEYKTYTPIVAAQVRQGIREFEDTAPKSLMPSSDAIAQELKKRYESKGKK